MVTALERHEIECFLVLAEELHFGRTAERLVVSRAHVSQTVKKLERRIGAPLFVRTSRSVGLTPLGQQLHDDLAPHYQAMGEAIDRAIATARGLSGTLRVGFLGALWETCSGPRPTCSKPPTRAARSRSGRCRSASARNRCAPVRST